MTASSPDQLAPGAVLAERYEIIRRLGVGGMGAVYLARHQLMDRLCALKVLPPGQNRDREALARFTREAQNASRIVHNNVCTVYDFGTTDEGVAYLAMEYLEGRTLGAILTEQPRLPLDRAIRLTRAIAAGLDAAHELGIVHRDLKPDNVMVLLSKTGETVKLVDFGIAKALQREPEGGVTAPGVVIGTPDYMAPEQFAGDPLDPRADIYSLGVMFYRMVTGTLPHQGESARDTLTKRLTEPPRPLKEALPDGMFPEGLQAVITRVLARRPAERYPTAGAFGTALVELFTGPLDIATMPTVRLDAATTPVTAPPARGRTGAVLAGVGVLGAVAFAAFLILKPETKGTPGLSNTPVNQPPPTVLPPPPGAVPPSTPVDSHPGTRPGTKTTMNPTVPPHDTASAATSPPPPRAGTPAPTQADLEGLDPLDPAQRDAVRAKAVQFYSRDDADPDVRARAAFIVALALAEEKRYAEADRWVENAIVMNGRAKPGKERDDRAQRYGNWRGLNSKKMTSDTTGT